MKKNMPVTDNEVVMTEGQTLVSKTNLKGSITYVNPDFISISGYSEEELIGKNHNVVRHPDMPPAAFKDLWDTVKQGRPWNGIVKNRCKNGDFYWVNASVIPITQNGQEVEYMSVRSKPTAEMVSNAEALYKEINAGRSVLKPSFEALKDMFGNLSVKKKLLSVFILIALIFSFGAFEGLRGLNHINDDWGNYQSGAAQRAKLLQEMKSQLGFGGAIHNFKNYVLRGSEKYVGRTENNLRALSDAVEIYRNIPSVTEPELNALLDIQRVANLYEINLQKIQTMVESGDSAKAIDMAVKINDSPAIDGFSTLVESQRTQAERLSSVISAGIYSSKITVTIERIISLVISVLLIFMFIVRVILKPLELLSSSFKNINEGFYQNEINILRTDEIGMFMQGVHITQTKMRFELEDSARLTREATRIKNALDVCQTNVMVADNDLNIIYMNESVQRMFDETEHALRDDLPDFDASKLLGGNADVFHKNPAHQRQMLSGLKDTFETTIIVGGRTFSLLATPVFDESENRLGTAIEWNDRTEELARISEERRISDSNARMKQALDSVSANVMVADADLNIIYMNEAVRSTLRNAESAIRSEISQFSMDTLIGSNIDIFHQRPVHQRQMLENLTNELKASIVVGGRNMDLVVNPIINDDQKRIGMVVEWADMTETLALLAEERKISDTNARMKQALDTVSANVMVADGNRDIIYMNKAVTDTLTNAENDIRKDLSNFRVNNLIGNSIDVFHKKPEHQKQMLANLSSELSSNIIVGGRHMNLVVNPITNDQNERIGTVVEWTDRTNEVAIELEIDSLVEASANGDLSKRIDPIGKTGFFKKLAVGLNQTVESTDSFLRDMGVVLSAMSDGDLTKAIHKDYKGSFGELKLDVNTTINKLTDIITRIRDSSGLVHSASNEIYQGNDDLSRRTEAQASSLEETAASMEEITSTVKESSTNASEANGMSTSAKKKAAEGGQVVKGAIEAMGEILESSNKIYDIIGVIDEIAFQTNLLALNAAVEAARAGEQGRGFAVVAGEVRTLSQRSAAAAKEIKDLIRDSMTKVESGSKLVNESGETLGEIVTAIDDVASRVEGIANSAAEQHAGIGQINQAITQMDDMTQQNAALVEEASAASEALSEQAGILNNLVGFFSVGGMVSQAINETYKQRILRATVTPLSSGQNLIKASVTKYNGAKRDNDSEWEEF